ncbi:MAG: hypothetical protein M0T70_07425, partial [Geobacteraceae bacterium]|nr:hypothetical protein [Geobacteraceae bacterium]
MAVGFFTQDIEFTLPHPPIPQRTILLLCKVIRRAWQLLSENPPTGFILHAEKEDTVTQMLVEIIENRLRKNGDVDGFDSARFGRVVRERSLSRELSPLSRMLSRFFQLQDRMIFAVSGMVESDYSRT